MRTPKFLIAAALITSSLALAAPVFTFVKDGAMNGAMTTMAGKDVIELAAAPSLKLLARNIGAKQATFIYSTASLEKDSKTAFEFYEKAFVKSGWKSAGMMGAAMGGAMDKPAEGAMTKPADGTMTKPADGTMTKPADGAMMGKAVKLEEKFTFKSSSISLKVSGVKDRVQVDLELK